MTDSAVRFPNVVIVSAETDVSELIKRTVSQLGCNSVVTTPSIEALSSSALSDVSLAVVDLDSLKDIRTFAFKLESPLCRVVAIGKLASLSPIWRLFALGVDDLMLRCLLGHPRPRLVSAVRIICNTRLCKFGFQDMRCHTHDSY